MAKKQTSGLPSIKQEAPPDTEEKATDNEVLLAASESHTLAGEVTVTVPVLNLNGYTKRRIDVYLTPESARNWKRVFLGLEQQEARLKNGKIISSVGDAIRYVGEQLAEK